MCENTIQNFYQRLKCCIEFNARNIEHQNRFVSLQCVEFEFDVIRSTLINELQIILCYSFRISQLQNITLTYVTPYIFTSTSKYGVEKLQKYWHDMCFLCINLTEVTSCKGVIRGGGGLCAHPPGPTPSEGPQSLSNNNMDSQSLCDLTFKIQMFHIGGPLCSFGDIQAPTLFNKRRPQSSVEEAPMIS